MNHSALRSAAATWLLSGIPTSFLFVTPVTASPATPAIAFQGDAKELLQQGHEMLRRGDDAGALEKFRAAIATNPSNEDAWRIYKEVDQNLWLGMLAKGGDYEQIARAMLAKANPGIGDYKKDPAVIDPLVDQALGDDFGARQIAIAKLAGSHGPFAIQHLVGGLSDAGNDNRRIRAMEAAYRIGQVGVPALISILDSADMTARRSAAVVLGRIRDMRAVGHLAYTAQVDGDPIVKTEARNACEAIGGKDVSATQALTSTALNFLRQHPDFVRPIDINNIAWELVDGKLVDASISRAMYGLEMARRAALKGLTAAPENSRALGVLAMVEAEARILSKGLAEEHAKVMSEKMPSVNEELRLCGPEALMTGIQISIEMGDSRLACELIQEVAFTTAAGSSETAGKLMNVAGAAKSREVRLTAAACATMIDHHMATSETVAPLLAEAVGERVQRVAVLIDENDDRRGAFESGFTGARWYCAASDSGLSGLARVRRFAGADLILISSSLKDVVAEQLITDLRGDDRTKSIPILAICGDKDIEGTKTRFGDKIKSAISKFDDKAMDAAIEGMNLNPERARAEELASLAARMIAEGPSIPNSTMAMSLAALADAAGGRADSVRIPAIDGLARFGGEGQQSALAGVLNDANASNAAKASAGLALAGLGSRGVNFSEDVLKALEGALSQTDTGVRAAAATALGRSTKVDPATRVKILQLKQMTLTTGKGAAPAGANQ